MCAITIIFKRFIAFWFCFWYVSKVLADPKSCIPKEGTVAVELMMAYPRPTRHDLYKLMIELKDEYFTILIRKIQLLYPGSKYGYFEFLPETSDTCYHMKQPFIDSVLWIDQNIQYIPLHVGFSKKKKVFGALYSAAKDENHEFLWSDSFTNDLTLKYIKIILLLNDEIGFPETKNSEGIVVEKSCNNQESISTEDLGNELQKKNIALIGLLEESSVKQWKTYLQQMNCKGSILKIDVNDINSMIEKILLAINELVCSKEIHENGFMDKNIDSNSEFKHTDYIGVGEVEAVLYTKVSELSSTTPSYIHATNTPIAIIGAGIALLSLFAAIGTVTYTRSAKVVQPVIDISDEGSKKDLQHSGVEETVAATDISQYA